MKCQWEPLKSNEKKNVSQKYGFKNLFYISHNFVIVYDHCNLMHHYYKWWVQLLQWDLSKPHSADVTLTWWVISFTNAAMWQIHPCSSNWFLQLEKEGCNYQRTASKNKTVSCLKAAVVYINKTELNWSVV